MSIPDNLPKHKYTPLEVPPYSFYPEGYEPWGDKPKYRLVHSHKFWKYDLRFNRRFDTQKRNPYWIRFPGWRLGLAASVVFMGLETFGVTSIKKTYFDHVHSDPHWKAEEHSWFGKGAKLLQRES